MADVQAQALAYLKEQQADADALAKATELWTDVPEEPTGDAVLAGIARRITEELRSTDWVARYGGEEILIVMRDTEVTGAADVLERIRTSVAASPFVGPGGEHVAVTISAGVAEAEAAEDIGSLKERLSGALLVAKRGGRNRVVSV